MSRFLSRPAVRRAARAITATALLSAATAGLAAAPASALPSRAELDGPGRLYALRTFESGAEPTAAQKASCKTGLGPEWALTQISALEARYYAPTVDPTTGLVTDPDARLVGPIFGCLGVTASLSQPGTSWGKLPLSLGTIEARGRCSLHTSPSLFLATYSGCMLPITPQNGRSGFVTSASYADLFKLHGTTTGSVWTAFVAGAGDANTPVAVTPAPNTPKVVGLKHAILRGVGQAPIPVAGAGCPNGTKTAARAALHAQAPDPASAELIAPPTETAAGTVTLCFKSAYQLSTPTTAIITIPSAGSSSNVIKAEGQCYHREIGLANDLRSQACDFEPIAPKVPLREGVITSNGLVKNGNLAQGENAAIWVIGGLGNFANPTP